MRGRGIPAPASPVPHLESALVTLTRRAVRAPLILVLALALVFQTGSNRRADALLPLVIPASVLLAGEVAVATSVVVGGAALLFGWAGMEADAIYEFEEGASDPEPQTGGGNRVDYAGGFKETSAPRSGSTFVPAQPVVTLFYGTDIFDGTSYARATASGSSDTSASNHSLRGHCVTPSGSATNANLSHGSYSYQQVGASRTANLIVEWSCGVGKAPAGAYHDQGYAGTTCCPHALTQALFVYDSATADRFTEGTLECWPSVGGAITTVVGQSPTYLAGSPLALDALVCPPGTFAKSLEVDRVMSGSGDRFPIYTRSLIPEFSPGVVDPQFEDDWIVPYPDCWAPGSCALEVVHDQDQDGLWLECTVGVCDSWWTDPVRDSEFRCMWGDYILVNEECVALELYYDDETAGQVHDETGAETSSNADPEYTDPLSDPSPEQTPGLDDGCVPKGWAILNPFSVVKAIGCSLMWAFVPTSTTTTALAEIKTDLATKTPFSELGSIAGWFAGLDNLGQQCWTISVPVEGYGTYDVLECEGAVYDVLVSYRGLMEIVLYGTLLGPLVWWAWKQYAPGSTGVA